MTRKNTLYKMSKSEAGRLGGVARFKHHGNPGTTEGRKKGGVRSLATHVKNKTGFILRKEVAIPSPSEKLAEFIGIFLGDGHVGMYQASITTNADTDYQHAKYVQLLVQKLFKIRATLSLKKNSNACTVVISSRTVCDFLQKNGLPQRNKIRDGVNIPRWIQKKFIYRAHCVRGLFDTDGSVYLDRHVIKGKEYRHIGLAFANQNTEILSFFKETLEGCGLHPTQKTPFRLFLRRSEEIAIFFKEFGSSNPKHKKRYKQFKKLVRHGGVG